MWSLKQQASSQRERTSEARGSEVVDMAKHALTRVEEKHWRLYSDQDFGASDTRMTTDPTETVRCPTGRMYLVVTQHLVADASIDD